MKIVSVDAMLLPEEKPSFTNSRPVLCRVHTDEGIYGLGEAGTTFFVGSDAVFAMIKEMSRLIIGMNPMENEVIWNKLYSSCYWPKGNGAIVMAAISAIDTALWDIKGKALNKPVYELLGGKMRDKLYCYASQLQFGFYDKTIPQCTIEDYRNVTQHCVDLGYKAVKTDPFIWGTALSDGFGGLLKADSTFGHFSNKALDIAEERIAVTREVLGKEGDIIIECHATTNLQSAIQVAKRMEKYDIMYMEEATDSLVPSGLKKLADSISIPLAHGERTYHRAGFLPYLQDGSVAMLQPDIGICGGITEMKKICDLSQVFDVGIQAHVCGSPISVAAGIQVEAAVANFTIHETHNISVQPNFTELGLYDDYTPVDGFITVPDRPGIGQDLSEKALKRLIVETVK